MWEAGREIGGRKILDTGAPARQSFGSYNLAYFKRRKAERQNIRNVVVHECWVLFKLKIKIKVSLETEDLGTLAAFGNWLSFHFHLNKFTPEKTELTERYTKRFCSITIVFFFYY